MLFAWASWATMTLAIILVWLWLQSVYPHTRGAERGEMDSYARATRTTLRSVALLTTLSAALLLLHFTVPEREALADDEWLATAMHSNHSQHQTQIVPAAPM